MENQRLKCWHCDAEQPEQRKLPFRATCDRCQAWQHCCKNCINYKPGMPNDCMILGTDPISDREASNFCEEFVVKGAGPIQTKSLSDVSTRLFGDEEPPKPKNPFESLFKD